MIRLTALTCSIVAFVLAGCTRPAQEQTQNNSGRGDIRIVAVTHGQSADPFWSVVSNGINDAAKDLGIFNVANALPQAIAPAVAPLILATTDGNYTWLFAIAGSIALLASITILPVKSVR